MNKLNRFIPIFIIFLINQFIFAQDAGYALSFDGGDDFVNMGDVLDFERTDSFTIETWIKMGSLTGIVPSIVAKRGGSSSNYKGYILGYHTTNNKLSFTLCMQLTRMVSELILP